MFYNAGETHPWADERGQGLTAAAAQTKFEEFLKSYYRDFQGQQDYGHASLTLTSVPTFTLAFSPDIADLQHLHAYLCRDALLKDKRQVRIDLTDIKSFDQELGFLLGNDPTQYLPLV